MGEWRLRPPPAPLRPICCCCWTSSLACGRSGGPLMRPLGCTLPQVNTAVQRRRRLPAAPGKSRCSMWRKLVFKLLQPASQPASQPAGQPPSPRLSPPPPPPLSPLATWMLSTRRLAAQFSRTPPSGPTPALLSEWRHTLCATPPPPHPTSTTSGLLGWRPKMQNNVLVW